MEIPVLNEIMRDTVVEVDLDRIAFNVRQIKAMAGPGTQVAAVVKADGYGHGAVPVAMAVDLPSWKTEPACWQWPPCPRQWS